ncbi:MAG: chemotaxis protein CheW [Cyanobacteria bacterium RI_101]|jgi:twitching motility protein PilI|nr:chemotaxis protein CheW [Cyanobacteria bacterium RI_101]
MVGQSPFISEEDSQFSPDLQAIQGLEGELHLRFYLPSKDEFALPAIAIREVMQQPPDRITPIPNASPLLLGTINLRGQVIWVADLGQFLGNTTPLNTDRAEIPVIAVEDQETILGLAIDGLGDMEWLDPEKLQLSNNVPDHIAPYVQGEWTLSAEERQHVLRLLDHVAILRSARWAT